MSRKIATVTAVFNACEHLELSATRNWNRDDVRTLVGGGGYNVIDPLIKAWRKIKPLREVAPTTPSEVLHLMAESIEAHLNQFTHSVEQREKQRQSVFETAVDELSSAIVELESRLESIENVRAVDMVDKAQIQRDKKSIEANIAEKNAEINRLRLANDELHNLVERLREENANLTATAARIQEQLETTTYQLSDVTDRLAAKESDYNRLLTRYNHQQSDTQKDAKLDLLHAQLLDMKRIVDSAAK